VSEEDAKKTKKVKTKEVEYDSVSEEPITKIKITKIIKCDDTSEKTIAHKNKSKREKPNKSNVGGSKTLKKHKSNKTIKKRSEKWKAHPEKLYKDKYMLSNYGRIKSVATENILNQNLRSGYNSCQYSNDGTKKHFRTHRLVAILFVPNKDPKKNKIVNHIDGNKLNNYYKNLEWTTASKNTIHASKTGLTPIYTRKVHIYDLDMNHISTHESIKLASEAIGVDAKCIGNVCRGNRKTSGGYIFKYADINPNQQDVVDLTGYKQLKKYPNSYINKEGKLYSILQKKFRISTINANGCHNVCLKASGQKSVSRLIHNIVAQYFLKKPKNKEVNCVRHKDGNKSNNHVSNLKWVYVAGVTLGSKV
jgi:hypothetical protein